MGIEPTTLMGIEQPTTLMGIEPTTQSEDLVPENVRPRSIKYVVIKSLENPPKLFDKTMCQDQQTTVVVP